jgi:hypothetical protein
MTDLVKRLRVDRKVMGMYVGSVLLDHYEAERKEAANRIEKLEAALWEAIAIVAAHVPSGYSHLRKALEGKDD